MTLPSRDSGWSVPALDILKSHIGLRCHTIVDTISDNAATGAMVLAERPVPVDQVDLRRVGALLYRNQTIEQTGIAAALLSHPTQGAWRANKLSRHDTTLGKR